MDGAVARVSKSIPSTPAAEGMRWLLLPDGVTDVRYATVQPVNVQIKLAASTFELPSSRPLQVFDDSLVAVAGPTPTPEVIAWANANRIVLSVSCRSPVPTELHRISCSGGEIDPTQLAAATKLQVLKVSIVSFADQPGPPAAAALARHWMTTRSHEPQHPDARPLSRLARSP